jgi:hypothetical protein
MVSLRSLSQTNCVWPAVDLVLMQTLDDAIERDRLLDLGNEVGALRVFAVDDNPQYFDQDMQGRNYLGVADGILDGIGMLADRALGRILDYRRRGHANRFGIYPRSSLS